jgi:hypothetical protein
MLWVHATLVETSLAVFRRFAGALTEAEREAYSREMGIVARVFGVWPTLLPRTFADFREYLAAQLDGPEIVVTATGAGRRRSNPPRAASGRAASAVPAHRLSTTVRPDLRLLALLRELSAGLTLPHEPGAVERHWEWRLEAVLERDFPTRRSRASDRLDVLALAVALPRCRLVTCDAFMADVVRRTGLDVRFRCELFTGRRVDVERLRGRLKSFS